LFDLAFNIRGPERERERERERETPYSSSELNESDIVNIGKLGNFSICYCIGELKSSF